MQAATSMSILLVVVQYSLRSCIIIRSILGMERGGG